MLEKPGSDGGRTEFQSFIVRRTEPGVRNQKVANCTLGPGWGGGEGVVSVWLGTQTLVMIAERR